MEAREAVAEPKDDVTLAWLLTTEALMVAMLVLYVGTVAVKLLTFVFDTPTLKLAVEARVL